MFCSCIPSYPVDEIVATVGEFESSQGYGDYCNKANMEYTKYQFCKAKPINFENNRYFKKINLLDYNILIECLNKFKDEAQKHFDTDGDDLILSVFYLDLSQIDSEDYLYMTYHGTSIDNGITTLTQFSIYFFDVQDYILYQLNYNT